MHVTVLKYAALILIAFAPQLSAQHHALVVDVAEDRTGAFVPNAEVVLQKIGIVRRTNWQGETIFNVGSDDTERIQVRKLGFASSDLVIPLTRDTTLVLFRLQRIASLDTLQVLSRGSPAYLGDFEVRRHNGIGRFLTDSALEANREATTAVLFSRSFPGVRLLPDTDGTNHLRLNCRVFLDGYLYAGRLDDLQPADLAGVEYYDSRGTTPVLFRTELPSASAQQHPWGSDAGRPVCTILMWSRRY